MLDQKNFSEIPNAIDGTIIGILINVSRTPDTIFPKVFRAINIAIGKPRSIPNTVTTAAKPYERNRLCQ